MKPSSLKELEDNDGRDRSMISLRRRDFLIGTAMLLFNSTSVRTATIGGRLPWSPNAGNPPLPFKLGPWQFFSGSEGRTMEALADCIIPPDAQTPGGKDAGCAEFVDRQLAGPYGRQEGLYLRPPFQSGMKNQGHQSEKGPAQTYREGLASMDRVCKERNRARLFAELSDDEKIEVLKAIESGELSLGSVDGKSFFAQVIKDVQMGFFADPLYGGNRDLVAWKMIGYPGARYNYLDWVDRHNERFPLPPVGMTGNAQWVR